MVVRSLASGVMLGVLVASALMPRSAVQAQAVVQAPPQQEAAQLNAALRRLASRPTDLDALLSAGNAALGLRNASAAAGFMTRAAAVAPGDPRVILGQARVALEQRRPVEALAEFARAEQAGANPRDMAADRALAYDLVGDNAAAQAMYRDLLARGDNAEMRRRLALSLAIAGNRGEFERVLNPLLQRNDRSAYRTRAFGLAVLGSTDEAVRIADAMMPTDLALRMAPYLRYMPRLTKAQQAAAGNLGAFPAASEIGRDAADIAGYAAAGARVAARANTALTPTGAALGPRATPPARQERVAVATQPPPLARPVAPVRAAAVAARVEQAGTLAPSAPAIIATVSVSPPPAAAPPAAAAERQSISEAFAEFGTAPASARPGTAVAPGAVDVARLAAAAEARAAREERTRADRAKADREKAEREKADRARADKAEADKRRAEALAKAAEPSRRWLQLGVGRNTAAFAFDWKRLSRQAGSALDGKGPWAVRYGASNRMLAGPYATEAALQAALKALKAKDIAALPFVSEVGEKVARAN